ncbi:MAG: pilus assembly protein TadG-related protein [Actinomycetes bacterium]|jgi:hypothetical protein
MITCGRQESDDQGQVLILILGFVVMLALFTSIVIDTSHVFMARRSLVAAADATALAAAQGINERAVYEGKVDGTVPLSPMATRQQAARYVSAAHLLTTFSHFRVDAVRTNGRWVNVTLSAQVRLPIFNVVTSKPSGFRISASSRAHTVVGR